MEHWEGILDCFKAFILKPGDPACNQKAYYNANKWSNCSVYLTVTTLDGLIMYKNGPKEGRSHDMTLSRESNLDEVMQDGLVIEGKQFYVYDNNGFVMSL